MKTKIDPIEARARQRQHVKQRKREHRSRLQERIQRRLASGQAHDEVARYVYGLIRQFPAHALSIRNLLDGDMLHRVLEIHARAKLPKQTAIGAASDKE